MRDDFPPGVKNQVAARVGWLCSNPECRQPTSGPSDSDKLVTNVGVAAHITAAAAGGPRFDATLTAEERRAPENAIWLCQKCAKAIDDDPTRYTPTLLRSWKALAEERAREAIEKGPRPQQTPSVTAAVYLGPNAISISGPNAVSLGPNAIKIVGPVIVNQGSLSTDAQELLVAASQGKTGDIHMYSTFGGQFVAVDDRQFVETGNPRSAAKWRAAVEELSRQRLVESRDRDGFVFSLTDAGYRLADQLKRGGAA
jgi:hypothetical protein